MTLLLKNLLRALLSGLSLLVCGLVTAGSLTSASYGQVQSSMKKQKEALARHPFFMKVDYVTVSEHIPFVFYVQQPAKRTPDYVANIVKEYLGRAQRLEREFVNAYVKPLGLHKNPTRDIYSIAILASEGDYLNYRKATGSEDLRFARAHYDPRLQLAVSYQEPFSNVDQIREQRHAVLHEFVHALQHSYFTGRGSMPAPIWFAEGQAEYLASRNESTEVGMSALDLVHLRLLADTVFRQRDYQICINSLSDLVSSNGPGYQVVMDTARRRAKGGAIYDFTLPAFYAQSALFMAYLHEAGHGRYRPNMLAYTKGVMRGAAGFALFEKAFKGVNLTALEGGFYRWIGARYPRAFAGRSAQLPRIRLLTVGLGGNAKRTEQVVTIADATVEVRFDPEDLALPAKDWRLGLAAAIVLAGRGRLEDALSALQLTAKSAGARKLEDSERIAAEIARVGALRDLRTAVLSTAVRKSKKLKLHLPGRRLEGYVAKIEDKCFLLATGKKRHGKIASDAERELIDLSELAADELTRQGRILGLGKGKRAWLNLYAAFITERAPTGMVKRMLKSKDPSTKALAAQRDDYAALYVSGQVAADLLQLRLSAQTKDRATALANLEILGRLVRAGSKSQLVSDKKPVLERYAEYALGIAFDPQDMHSMDLHGKVETLADGRFRVSYDWSKAEQLADWVDLPKEASKRAKPRGQLLTDDGRGFVVHDNSLFASGSALRRFIIPVAAPWEMHFDVILRKSIGLEFGFCTDGFGNGIWSDPIGNLGILDQQQRLRGQLSSSKTSITIGETLKVIVRHDGKALTFAVDGQVHNKIAKVGKRISGYMTLFVHANDIIEVSELSISGAVDKARMDGLRSTWIQRRKQEIFGG